MFSAITNDAERSAFEAMRSKVSATLNATQREAQISVKEGALSIEGVFLGNLPPPKGKAANVAAAGQGGEAAKAPPTRMQVMLLVGALCRNHVVNSDYEIVDGSTIRIPARNNAQIKKAKDILKTAVQAHAEKSGTVKSAGRDPTVECAAEKAAEDAARLKVEEAFTVSEYVTIRHGETYVVSTFEPGATAARSLKPLQNVNLVGVTASVSFGKDGKKFVGVDCSSPLALISPYAPYVTIGRALDLCQIPIRLEDPMIEWGAVRMILFMDYMRTAEEEKLGRGSVVCKYLSNSERTEDYKRQSKEKTGEATLCATWRMWQKQDGTKEGYPAGDHEILATFIEGDWTPENQRIRNALRLGFGINKADTFAAIMAANPVPAIIACSYNTKDTPRANADKNWQTDAGRIISWANGSHFCLREYLLNQCAQVSVEYVRAMFGIEADVKDISLENDNPERPCQLNGASLVKRGNKYTLARTGAINVNEYTGNLSGLMVSCENPPQFRVMHSVPLDSITRQKLAMLPTKDAEKVLSNDMSAPIRLNAQSMTKQIYMVQSMDEDERDAYKQADESWRVRIEAEKRAAAARAAALLKKEQEDQGEQQMDQGEEDQLNFAQDQQQEDEDALEAVRQAEAEAAKKALMDNLLMEEEEQQEEPVVPQQPPKRSREEEVKNEKTGKQHQSSRRR